MGNFKNSPAKSTVLLAAFMCFFILRNFSQNNEIGVPFIQNIHPNEYAYENENYSIVQDDKGIIYVGSYNGIMEYDGYFWDHIEVEGEINLSYASDGKVYVGAYDDFGLLKRGKKGNLEFHSLLTFLDEDERSFGQITSVLNLGEIILFTADKNLFLWDNNNIQIIASTYTFFKSFLANNKIYIYKHLDGLYSLRSNALELVDDGDYFVDKEILEIVPFENGVLIKTKKHDSPFLYSEAGVISYETDADQFFKTNGFTKSVRLENKNYAIGTERCGVVFINKFGRVLGHINKSNGLIDDKVNNIYVDRSSNIWLALSNGISRLEYPSKFSFFDYSSGIRGAVSDITRHKGTIYVATTQGVFYLNDEFILGKSCLPAQKFIAVSGINADTRFLLSTGNKLLVATKDGLFEIASGTSRKIMDGNYYSISNSRIDPSVFYLAKKTGLAAIQHFDNNFIELGDLQNLNKRIESIYETENGMLWLGSAHNGIFMVDMSAGFDIYNQISQYKTPLDKSIDFDWVDIFNTSQGAVFSTKHGLYSYNKEEDAFIPNTMLGNEYAGGNNPIYILTQDKNENIWFSAKIPGKYQNVTHFAQYDSIDKQYKAVKLELGSLGNYKLEAIFPEEDNITWFGGYNGLIRYDDNILQKPAVNYQTLIRKVILQKDSVLSYGSNITNNKDKTIVGDMPEISHEYNSIRFEFASPKYQQSNQVHYQYILEGYEKNWSEWTTSHHKEYTNLRRGKYVFKVRSKNKVGDLTGEAAFGFKMRPSPFNSIMAYIYYLIAAVSFVFMLTKWRSYRFAKERFELEQIINARTEELAYEKEKADELFAKATSDEELSDLIIEEKEESKRFKMVSVLMVELSGFNHDKEKQNKEVIDKIFKYFDVAVERHSMVKIKSSDTHYTCCAGIPEISNVSPVNATLAAMEMIKHLEDINENNKSGLDHRIHIQIAIHTGPIAALFASKKKTPYDITGETVNITKKILVNGEIGRISVSEITQKIIDPFFICKFMHKLQVKFLGDIERYVIEGFKPDVSVNGAGQEPNEVFKTKLALLRFNDLQNDVFYKLDHELPKSIHFHNSKHALNLINETSTIGIAEHVAENELLLLKTAALFYNTGFTKSYKEHEVKSLKIAKDILPAYGYNNEQINAVSDLIYAIKKPDEPKNNLEMIIKDAYYDYLGSHDFNAQSRNLYKELFENKIIEDDFEDWHAEQVDFLEKHVYYTDTAKKLKDSHKQKTIDHLKNRSTYH